MSLTINEQIYGIVFKAILEHEHIMDLNVFNAEMATEDIQALLLQSQVDLLNEVYDLIGTDSPKSSIKEMISELKQQINNLSK